MKGFIYAESVCWVEYIRAHAFVFLEYPVVRIISSVKVRIDVQSSRYSFIGKITNSFFTEQNLLFKVPHAVFHCGCFLRVLLSCEQHCYDY